MSGKVTADGEDVIGATIEAIHVPSGTKYMAVTNTKGAFTITGMRPGGPYNVKVSYIGYRTKDFTDLKLSLGETYDLPVWLEADTKELGEVVVTGQAGVNNTRNGAVESIGNARLEELPSLTHSVADVARINPFVKVTEGGAMYFAGSNNRYNSIMIDGAMSNDVFGLTANGANGGQAGTQAFSMETIDQLQVSIAPFDVRQSGFTGGAVNAITKSGTNDFHGSVYSYFQNGDMVSDKYKLHNGGTSSKYGSLTDNTFGATLGGPLVKDKLFFFANFERSKREYDDAHRQVTKELAALFPAYINSLGLKKKDGTALTADNYLDYIKEEIIRSAQIAKDAGADIPDSIGFSFNNDAGTFAPVNGGVGMGQAPKDLPAGMAKAMGGMRGMNKRVGEYIIGLDMTKYLNYVANKTPLKTAPAFDALGVAGDAASGENDEFGDANNVPANFTDYSAAKNNTTVSAKVKEEEYLLNPMEQIGQQGVTVAPHWYIRHGAIDRDTAFPIPLNLATKLENEGKDVNFLLAWNRPHSGDYALNELFNWIDSITKH